MLSNHVTAKSPKNRSIDIRSDTIISISFDAAVRLVNADQLFDVCNSRNNSILRAICGCYVRFAHSHKGGGGGYTVLRFSPTGLVVGA